MLLPLLMLKSSSNKKISVFNSISCALHIQDRGQGSSSIMSGHWTFWSLLCRQVRAVWLPSCFPVGSGFSLCPSARRDLCNPNWPLVEITSAVRVMTWSFYFWAVISKKKKCNFSWVYKKTVSIQLSNYPSNSNWKVNRFSQLETKSNNGG